MPIIGTSSSHGMVSRMFSATGGQETAIVGLYKYHIFTASDSLIVSGSKNMEVLVVGAGAGGGGGYQRAAGGGGAGGVSPASGYSTVAVTTGTQSITIGSGGNGGNPGSRGSGGSSSSGLGVSAPGGGGGGSSEFFDRAGGSGGSGGGSCNGAAAGGNSGTNTNPGGVGSQAEYDAYGGGGGGAASAGGSPGGGGAGLYLENIDANLTGSNFPNTISGKNYISAGGSGGLRTQSGGASTPGTPSGYGSGGGGGNSSSSASAAGGRGANGLVIVRYAI